MANGASQERRLAILKRLGLTKKPATGGLFYARCISSRVLVVQRNLLSGEAAKVCQLLTSDIWNFDTVCRITHNENHQWPFIIWSAQ